MPDRVISVPQATQIATKIKNKFDNVNGRLQLQSEILYADDTALSQASSTGGYKMGSDGAFVRDTNYTVSKFTVTAGQTLHITAEKESDGVWCFRDAIGSTSNVIGSVNTTGGSAYATVPTGATYLFLARLKTTDTDTVYTVNTLLTDVESNTSKINGIDMNIGVISAVLEHGNLNMTDGASTPTASHYREGTRARTAVNNPVPLTEGDKIQTATGYVIYVCYNAGEGLVKSVAWVSEYTLPADGDVWFIVRPQTEVADDTIPLETLADAVTIISSKNNTIIKRIIALEEKSVSSVPEHYVDHMTEKVAEINENSRFISGVCFPFITDIHFDHNTKNSKYLLKDVLDKTSCDYVISGGDYGMTAASADVSRACISDLLDYASYVGHDKFFALVGNHDFTGSEALTWGETYNAICRPSERYKTNVTNEGSFCIDIPAQKTRFICINSTPPQYPVSANVMNGSTTYFGASHLNWIFDRLTELSGYNIIFMSHIATDPEMYAYVATFAPLQTMLELFANKQSGMAGSITVDFTSTTNKLICHISGHAHRDESHYSNGVLSIATTCDAHYQDDGHGAAVGTVTEQAFDVYCIDFDAETITAVRVGRGASRKWAFDGTVLSDATD